MTNVELIAKIKVEIERLKATNPSEYNYQNAEGYVWALDDILSFLSTLELKKPVPADLEEAANEYAYRGIPDEMKPYVKDIAEQIIKNFIAGAKWQADHTPLPEDTVLFNKGVVEGKRLMMEEAVGATVHLESGANPIVTIGVARFGLKVRDKVKVIIVKEEN